MSQWIRTGRDELWHRILLQDAVDPPTDIGFRCLCGVRLPATSWQDIVDELVPPDDQHPPCRDRALRESYWRKRIPPGDLARFVREAAVDLRPDLERPLVEIRPDGRGAWVAGLRGVGDSWGNSPAAAVADLLATLEDGGFMRTASRDFPKR